MADLGEFLVIIGELENAEDVENLEFDRGEVAFEDGGGETYSGNGIPTRPELKLLERILTDASFDRRKPMARRTDLCGGTGNKTLRRRRRTCPRRTLPRSARWRAI